MSIQVFKPLIREESVKAVSEVLTSGWIGQGPKTKAFEEAFVEYLGNSSLHASALNSATSALHLALKLLNLKKDDHVITTSLTFVSTNHVLLYEGLKPIFVDVDRETGNISPEEIELTLRQCENNGKPVGAIMVVHYAGFACDMDKINSIAKKYNVPVIEDCAHACGASYSDGKKVGDSENICCFSFQAVKNLPIGDGGMLVTNNPEYKKRCDQLRWLGIDKDTYSRSSKTGEYLWKYDVPNVGYKYHMNDINAAIGLEQLKYLDSDNNRRKEIAKRYRDELSDVLCFLKRDHDGSSMHFEPALAEKRDALIKHLKAHDVSPGVHYRRNDHYATYTSMILPKTKYLEDRLITLPIHLLLTEEDITKVIKTVKKGW